MVEKKVQLYLTGELKNNSSRFNIELSEKMRLFQSVQSFFAIVGITSYQSMQKHPFNHKILATFFSYSLTMTSYNVYLFHVATTFWEYNDNIYMNSATMLVVIGFTIVVFNIKKLFEFIDSCEAITIDSKQQQIHAESINLFNLNTRSHKKY